MKSGINISIFNLFNDGHLNILEQANRLRDYLIIGFKYYSSLNRFEKNGPFTINYLSKWC